MWEKMQYSLALSLRQGKAFDQLSALTLELTIIFMFAPSITRGLIRLSSSAPDKSIYSGFGEKDSFGVSILPLIESTNALSNNFGSGPFPQLHHLTI
jgi:hypothetical protein